MTLTHRGWAAVAVATMSLVLLGPRTSIFLGQLSGPDFPDAALALLCLTQLVASAAVLSAVCLGMTGRIPACLAAILVSTAIAAPASAGVGGLQLPDRPVTSPHPPQAVVVQPGDCLWTIAQRAGAADVATAVDDWYTANREVIGTDPDLIQPGQHLRRPR